MDRRDFLRRSIGKAGETVVRHADEKLAEKINWIRPPFALPELDFLLTCTRCNACIEACPHQVIFPLASRLGPEIVKTPALDLLNRGCHMCSDWPCTMSCEAGALQRPSDQALPTPKLATIKINTGTCLPYLGPECGACRESCPVEGALTWEEERPQVDHQYCTGCALCREACIIEPKAIDIELAGYNIS